MPNNTPRMGWDVMRWDKNDDEQHVIYFQSFEFNIFHISSPITLTDLPIALIVYIRLPDNTEF